PVWFIRQQEYPRLWWEGPKADLKLAPQTLNCRSQGNWIKAHLTLPEGFNIADIDTNKPAALQPLNLTSEKLEVFIKQDNLVEVNASFDRQSFCSASVRIITPGMKELADFAAYWLQSDCKKPLWCSGLDLNHDSMVNLLDFALLQKSRVEFIPDKMPR
ncbi:MAG: hypothetical protein AMJ79_10275, partial [Phycisphaerae bacterium SM23_30]